MENIEKMSKINQEALSSEHYFQSLLEQAYKTQILSDTEFEKIQFDCLTLLMKKTEQYNSGDSSSIRVEKAQDILQSIMFTIGVQLKSYQSPSDAIVAVQKEGVDSIFQVGRKQIDRLIKQAKTLQISITRYLLQTKNVFYDATIVDGINGFFKLYYPDFSAHEIHITADYPVHQPMERLLGIEFIGKYLEQLYYENAFCTLFSSEDVHHLLWGYDEHYELLLFNLYELVLTAAIGCILLGEDFRRLERTSASTQALSDLFKGKSRPEVESILYGALEQLGEEMEVSTTLKQYLRGSIPQIAASIETAVSLQTLERVFVLPRYLENNPKLVVSFGEKMDNEKYRRFLEEFMQCRHLADKQAMIKRGIHSLADLEDILLDGELYDKEILGILNELSPVEIVGLLKNHPLTSDIDQYDMRESDILLSECLQHFLTGLPPKQQEMMQQAVAMLDTGEE